MLHAPTVEPSPIEKVMAFPEFPPVAESVYVPPMIALVGTFDVITMVWSTDGGELAKITPVEPVAEPTA
jgi:hypothetical protein